MRSKSKLTILNVPETELEVLLRRSSDYLKKTRKIQPLSKPAASAKKSVSAA